MSRLSVIAHVSDTNHEEKPSDLKMSSRPNRFQGFFAYPPEKVYSSDQTARSGGTGIWSNCWMSAGRSMVSGALRNS